MIRREHWYKAGALAVLVHAAMLVGLRPHVVGESSPPPGPTIEIATSMPGIIGSIDAALESDAAEPVEALEEPEHTSLLDAEQPPAEVLEPLEADTTPPPTLVTPDNPVAMERSFAKQQEPERIEKSAEKTEAKKKKAQKKKLRKKVQTQKKKVKKKRKNKSESTRASKRGNARKGAAGTKRAGGGKSRASAGAVNRYASRVRARILSRRPGSGGRRGTTVISFQVTRSGGLSWARISRSSGSGSLDSRALSAVRRASPFPKPPAGARSGQLRFSIPFRFR